MIIVLLLCLIGNYVCCFLAAKIGEEEKDLKKRKDKSNFFFVTSVVLSIIASILLIHIIDNNSKGVAVAKYNYYINGKKVSSASYAGFQNLFIGIMFFAVFFGTGMGLSGYIMKRKNQPKLDKENKKPSIAMFAFSIISVIFALILIISAISVFTHRLKTTVYTGAIIATILGITLGIIGTWGIMTFIKRKNMIK